MKKAGFYIIEDARNYVLCKMSTDGVMFSSCDKDTLIEWAKVMGMKVLGESNGITYLK